MLTRKRLLVPLSCFEHLPLRRLCLCQATFLRGSTASELPDNPELRAQLEALTPEALEARCRRSGLSRRGAAADQVQSPLPASPEESRMLLELPVCGEMHKHCTHGGTQHSGWPCHCSPPCHDGIYRPAAR
jgi:hypothetical protein